MTCLALCAGLTLSGCGGQQVRSLAAEPITSTSPSAGELVISREDRAESGGLLGKPSPAQVLRVYAFESDAAARAAVTELAAWAEADGWKVRPVSLDERGFSATRHVNGRRATLTVARNLDPSLQPAPGVWVAVSQPGG